MKKIQKFGVGGATIALNLAPYSYSAPAISSTIASAGQAALPYLATAGQVAWPLIAAGGGLGLGLYTLANATHGGVSGAMSAAAERERQRHIAEAEAKWQEKNQHYADLINTYGSVQYPVGTFYNYDPSSGTAYLERNLGNGRIGRWTQNMRTREQGNPYVYDTVTGEIYNGEITGPNSAYVQMPKTTLSVSPVMDIPIVQTPLEMTYDSRLGDAIKIGWKAYRDSKKGSEALTPAPVPPEKPKKDPDEKGKGWLKRTFGKDPNAPRSGLSRLYRPYEQPWDKWNFIPRIGEQLLPLYGIDFVTKWFGAPWDEGFTYFTIPDARPFLRRLEHGDPVVNSDTIEDREEGKKIDEADTLGISNAEQHRLEMEMARKILNNEE